MKLFVPTEDPASEPESLSALLVPYHPDYPCLRALATETPREHGDPAHGVQEVRHETR